MLITIINFRTIHHFGDKSLKGLDITVLPPPLPLPALATPPPPTRHMTKGFTQDQDP